MIVVESLNNELFLFKFQKAVGLMWEMHDDESIDQADTASDCTFDVPSMIKIPSSMPLDRHCSQTG